MVEAKLLRKKLKNGLIVDKWDLVTIIEKQQAEIEKLNETVDKLLNHCDDPECWECGKIICPYGGEMHFHHDGCPTCAQMEAQEK